MIFPRVVSDYAVENGSVVTKLEEVNKLWFVHSIASERCANFARVVLLKVL